MEEIVNSMCISYVDRCYAPIYLSLFEILLHSFVINFSDFRFTSLEPARIPGLKHFI